MVQSDMHVYVCVCGVCVVCVCGVWCVSVCGVCVCLSLDTFLLSCWFFVFAAVVPLI